MANAEKTINEKTNVSVRGTSAKPVVLKIKAPTRKIYMAAKPGKISRARIRAAVRAMSQT